MTGIEMLRTPTPKLMRSSRLSSAHAAIGRAAALCALTLFSVLLLAAPEKRKPREGVAGPEAHVSTGQLRGAMLGSTAVFFGIPFAAPPVGNLRWREPQPPAPWQGVRDATIPGNQCSQVPTGIELFIKPLADSYHAQYNVGTFTTSEDCLFLNVWVANWPSAKGLPVMVWVHGGSNRAGSGTEAGYDGTALAAHGVIVVTLNYRLGVMGFFAHPELTAESPHHSSGNYGLLDQIAALRWVQENIAQFGGDPGNVTVFGESAGSIDVTTLMASPLAKGLFRRVIAESGPAFGLERQQDVAKMETLGTAVGKAAGVASGPQIEILRKLPPAQVAQLENGLIAAQFKGYDPNSSIVDGWVLPQSPAKTFATGAVEKTDLLVGMNAREFSAFRAGAAAAQKASGPPVPKVKLSDQISQFADATRPLYGGWTDMAVASYMAKILIHGASAVDQATGDIVLGCPIGAEAAMVTAAGQHAYVYRFERTVPGPGEAELGSFHALELPYVFGTFQAHTFSWLPFSATDHQLGSIVETYWTNFAKTGDPNGGGLPHWSNWNTGKEPYLAFTESGEAAPREQFSPNYCHLSPDRLKQQLGKM